VAVEEGNEPEEFWPLLGGVADYPKSKVGRVAMEVYLHSVGRKGTHGMT